MSVQYRCEKCGRKMNDVNFYTYRDGTKVEMCKSCLTMHVNNWDPETYLWILQKMDVPYIPSEWKNILDKAYAKDPNKINGTTVMGKYLAKMKLKQFNKFTWADTEKLKQEDELAQAREAEEQVQYEEMLKEKLDSGEINEAQYRTLVGSNTQRNVMPNQAKMVMGPTPEYYLTANPYDENNFIAEEEMNNMTEELTEEDKRYLILKWRPPL